MLDIHKNIKDKLKYFYSIRKIPNIIFNGPSGSGKSTLVNDFIRMIYDNDNEKIKNLVMYVNCAHGKGIRFIRDDLKFFAKTNIQSEGGNIFKSVILYNGDKLTIDAQSALRRCIELFSHNTRFFIIVEDKYKLLKPILSRFCELYISEPIINGKAVNLYKYNIESTFQITNIKSKRKDWLKKEMKKIINDNIPVKKLQSIAVKLYEKGYSALDIINLIEDGCFSLDTEKKYELLVAFSKVKKEFRSEKLLIFFVINFTFFDNSDFIEHMEFI